MGKLSITGLVIISLAVGSAVGFIVGVERRKTNNRVEIDDLKKQLENTTIHANGLDTTISKLKRDHEAKASLMNKQMVDKSTEIDVLSKQLAANKLELTKINRQVVESQKRENQPSVKLDDNIERKKRFDRVGLVKYNNQFKRDGYFNDTIERGEIRIVDDPKQGTFGYFPQSKTGFVRHVIDKNSAVVALSAADPTTIKSRSNYITWVFVAGVDTTKVADGQSLGLPMIFEVDGTQKIGNATYLKLISLDKE